MKFSLWRFLMVLIISQSLACKGDQKSKRFVGKGAPVNPNSSNATTIDPANENPEDTYGNSDDAGDDENVFEEEYEEVEGDEEIINPTGGFFVGLKPKDNPSQKISLSVSCSQQIDVNGPTILPQNRLIHIAGEVCLNADPFERFNVTLLIDTSGSMKQNDSKCKRAQSAIAIVNRIHNDSSTYADQIKYSVISFSSDAKTRLSLGGREQAIEAIKKSCGRKGGTDYKDAFREAKKEIQKDSSKKSYVFMFSDGQPGKKSSGENAAKELRDLNASLNFIYLSKAKSSSARDYLIRLTGNKPEQVKVAENVDQLLEAAKVINIPSPVTLIKEAVKVSLKIGSLPEQQASIATFEKDPNKEGYYRFKTDPITLIGGSGNFNAKFSVKVHVPGQNFQSELDANFTAP